MNDELIKITVDGQELAAHKGAMLIDVTDAAGIAIPRFCYHKKLSIAANCRMCLVDVEKAPKPLPACATPVADGMVVRTRSEKARAAQKAVMSFLLINHPLDCPICDQGGECELQDLSVGYGENQTHYIEPKRVVKEKNIGSLISTAMTRCIQCTRCVRFGEEIADLRELGATGRGERVEIGTYVEQGLRSELSANVIDICPVGALTAKPSRYIGRPWEFVQHESISPHDALGSNLYIHTLRGKVARVVPRENEHINEVWISDRDRFSYLALKSQDRAATPLVRMGEQGLLAHSWEEALIATRLAVQGVIDQYGVEQVGVLVSPLATVEELFLTQKLARGLGITHIDHRFGQVDFSDDEHEPVYPSLGVSIADVEKQQAALLIGCDLRMEQPLLAHRLRQAVKQQGAQVTVVGTQLSDFLVAVNHIDQPVTDLAKYLGGLLSVAAKVTGQSVPSSLQSLAQSSEHTTAESTVNALVAAEHGIIWLGQQAIAAQDYATIRALAHALAQMTGVQFGFLPAGGNATGAYLAGAIPHKSVGCTPTPCGKNTQAMLEQPLKAYLLVGAIDPELDLGTTGWRALQAAQVVVAMTPFASSSIQRIATTLLPIAAWAESSGSYINIEGCCQSTIAATLPIGQARPAWKVLRVLANQFDLSGFEYTDSNQVLEAFLQACECVEQPMLDGHLFAVGQLAATSVNVPSIYNSNAYVRRSEPLQHSALANLGGSASSC